MSRGACAVCLPLLAFAAPVPGGPGTGGDPGVYDVVWTSPSPDHRGSMPLGNGEIGLNAWFEPGGDLVFSIGRTDAWGDNGRLLKVGRVRVHLEPPIWREGMPFRQALRLRDATLEVRCGEGPEAALLEVWVDANHPLIQVTVESPHASTASAGIELWRTEPYELPSIEVSDVHLHRGVPGNRHAPTIVEPDTLLTGLDDAVGWYHHNTKSVGPALTATIQGLPEFAAPDPLLQRTFGALVTAAGGRPLDGRTLVCPASRRHTITVTAHTRHPSTPEQWLAETRAHLRDAEAIPFAERRRAHADWWHEFWQRSWIHVTPTGDDEPGPSIPGNGYPLRVGHDQHGANTFRGDIARCSVWTRALPETDIAALAAGSRDPLDPTTRDLAASWSPSPGTERDLDGVDLTRALTLEAWVRPTPMPASGGRILDKITPGGGDGFLLDTYPRNSLRFIVGRETLQAGDLLTADRWHHVAAVVDPGQGRIRVYHDGQRVAETAFETGGDAFVVSRAYALQRFIDACAGRGRYPIKFNGSIFTVPSAGTPGDADYRRWGPGYWWQNTRLPYLSMCASGDTEMMRPLFRLYAQDLMDLFVARTRRYFGHEGAYIPECIYFWGMVFSDTYGWRPAAEREDKLQEGGWHKWEWVSGPELVWLMLDFYEHTLDETFLRETLLPAAHHILTFFDRHYPTDEAGQLVMHPAQALETWWDCTNPMPELAGLRGLTERLLALPADRAKAEERAFWEALRGKLPPLPTRTVDGIEMLAPAARFEVKRNIENPELYAVFPFRQIAVGRPRIDLGIEALRHRWDRGHFGWRQDDLFMACLGLAEDARQGLVLRARRRDANSRFPAFWGPNYDWVPDQDHGGVLMRTLQAMILQSDGNRILLLPAWPRDWDLRFRLRAPFRTLVEGTFRDGRLQSLTVTPAERRRDVECPWPVP
ncbi:MAG: hypothetical protein JXR77_11795 [Lentisphaeria bacterium]|nr:hypothetical protein [Lentisphaeria bacterium]